MGIPQYDEVSGNGPRPDIAEESIRRFGPLNTLDDLIRLRAADAVQEPILAYPRPPENNTVSYEYFTGEDLDCLVDQTVCHLMGCGFKPPQKDGEIIALLTLSDLNMVFTFFALSRMGYTVMMLSPRLSAAACVSLLETVGCETILYGRTPQIRTTMGDILRLKIVTCRPIIECPDREEASDGPAVLVLNRSRNREAQRNKIALILHSSGSTGTPKPLFLSHKALMTHPLRGLGLTSFNSLPWYHLHGLSTALQAMYMRKVAFMWDASLPLTVHSVVAALEAAQPESVQGVPYLLQLLVDSARGLDALRSCKLVSYGGAPCPDDLGDRLVAEGVRFGGSFGLTEAGLVAESISRPVDDPDWNYMRFFENIQPYIWMKPIGNELYECVYLSGHPALTTSNSNEPPGSYHSRDVFSPHPSMPNRWKYISRLDDRITLLNGEKVLPLPIEGSIKQSPLIQEAVVVGVSRAMPGLLVFRAESAQHVADEDLLDLIWPTVQDANTRAEQFSQITREMVCLLPRGSVCPQTDKGSMIRAQVYVRYAAAIEQLYAQPEERPEGALQLDLDATEAHLMQLCKTELGFPISSKEADFFTEGVDSLKAIHLRRLILRDFRIGAGKDLGQNIVFEAGSVARLAKQIRVLQQSGLAADDEEDPVSSMQGLIEKYSSFRTHSPNPDAISTRKGVILTGATGSIGAHTLYRLLNDETVSVVYCLTRRNNPKQAILDALAQKGLRVLEDRTKRIVALKSALDQPDLGLEKKSMIEEMRQSVSLIIHTAWPVNFNLPLLAFEPHIRGLYNLIDFSLTVNMPAPAVTLFCSSISTALGAPAREIPEAPINSLDSALEMGYGRSKLIGERIVSNARQAGARAFSLRIGQVSGHSKRGRWNDSEATPLMIRSALTLKVLPALDTTCSWVPVDKLACSMLEIARACSLNHSSDDGAEFGDDSVYNLTNSRTFAWSSLLDTLRRNGFAFKTVPFNEWLQRLRESAAQGEELINPAVKLADHYESMYGGSSAATSKTFLTEKAERDSMTLRNGRLRIIQDGILARYAQDWLKRWKTA
ncbi:putative NRPS-like enzyme [Aspergillus rambellii]|uniref:Putative NRPS-like enzyme n=1 Tax=Aspergillus rambellii TaxID=308745 RepID=A0A0F8U0F4_9EURO|nr:putative NRPS-like enzyme [Aspergillus rambellii]